jgi:hypothetical protein
MTGWAMGLCGRDRRPGREEIPIRRGWGVGFDRGGRGRGWGREGGWGRGWRAPWGGRGRGYPFDAGRPLPEARREAAGGSHPTPDPDAERQMLIERADALRSELDAINRRLNAENPQAKGAGE